jgi:hypothetical protein
MQQVDEIKGILNLGGTSFVNSIVQVRFFPWSFDFLNNIC